MVLEKEIPRFLEWIGGAALQWCIVLGVLVALGLGFGLLVSIIRRGPVRGTASLFRVAWSALADVFLMSPRRISALAWLAVKESIRKKVVVAVGIFIMVLMLAGWFLDPASEDPGRLYLSFVMSTTSYLVLLLALFLSVFSLPGDLKNKTLHTVVTKPVRHSEIVLGRIVGFTAVCTFLLAVMAVLSYLFVVRGLAHEHVLMAADMTPRDAKAAARGEAVTLVGKTSKQHGHSHEVVVDPSGATRTRLEHGHTHTVVVDNSGPETRYRIGPPEGVLVARVPIRGKLRFRDTEGRDKKEGINVGDEWTYRSYIQGGTPAAAIWSFEKLRPGQFPDDQLPIEMTLGVFRTHKGEITRTVLGGLSLRNPDTGLTVEVEIFESKEFVAQRLWVPKQIVKYSNRQVISRQEETAEGLKMTPPPEQLDLNLAQKTEFDLFEDLVTPDGRLEIWLQCLEPGQHFGAAQPDLYLRAADASVPLNFVKGFYGIWLQVLVLTSFGVMFSTFLSGAVAMLATIGVLIAGFFTDFMAALGRGEMIGGGPIESFRRLVTQDNMMSDMTPGLTTDVIKLADRIVEPALRVAASLLPPFGEFSCANFVANGFNIPPDFVFTRTVTALAFLAPLFVIGYLFMRNREVAR